jgi:prepilin-type processing-associated H-X9-DG protein
MADLAQRGKGFERGCGGYGYNAAFVGAERREVIKSVWEVSTDRMGSRRARFRSPATTVGFADAALAVEEVIEYSFVEPAVWPQWPEYRPDPSTHFRHGEKASVAWLDGHVSIEVRSRWESSGVYPLSPGEVGIGWFGETGDNRLYDYQ